MLEGNRDKWDSQPTDVAGMAAAQQPELTSQDTAVIPTVTNIYVGRDYVGGNKITVGDISDSTGIAVGTGASANKGVSPQDKDASDQ